MEDMNDPFDIQHASEKTESNDITNSSFSASDSNNLAAPPSPESGSETSFLSRKSSVNRSSSSETGSQLHPDHDVEPEREDDQQETISEKISLHRTSVVSHVSRRKAGPSDGNDGGDYVEMR
ncbi:hypothetical protein MMC31_007809 [Peltigera leucophlebia]|nr:hypothetical protein [Peltigera leucophlebia]